MMHKMLYYQFIAMLNVIAWVKDFGEFWVKCVKQIKRGRAETLWLNTARNVLDWLHIYSVYRIILDDFII